MKYKELKRVCPICHSGYYSEFKRKPKWTPCNVIKDETGYAFHLVDVMCTTCGMIYKNPMLDASSQLDFYSGPYADLFKTGQQETISKTAINEGVMTTIYTLDWLAKIPFSLKGAKVFEVGTGMGILMKGMEGEGAEVFGIDADTRRIEIANKLFGFDFENVALQHLDREKHARKYDLVVCNNTLEHFYDPVGILDSLHYFLKEDGKVLLELPDARYPYPGTHSDGFLSSAHNHTFNRHNIDGLANMAGYDVEYIENAGHKKCFLILLKPNPKALNNPIHAIDTDALKEELLSIYKEIDTSVEKNTQFMKELSTGIYVNSIIYRIKEESPNTYNQRNIVLANTLLEQGKPLDALELLKTYGPNQPEDPNCNYGTFLYIKAMCYRQLGDFVLSKTLLTECAEHYPNIRKYNFVRDLEIDGLVSNSVFASYLWWNAEKILQTFG